MSSKFNEKKTKTDYLYLQRARIMKLFLNKNLFHGRKWQVVTTWSEIKHVISRVRREKQRWQALNTVTQFPKQRRIQYTANRRSSISSTSRALFKGMVYGFKPPPEIITRNFFHCIKITCSTCGLWCLTRSLWNARKSHLASTKCNKPLGRSGLHPGPRWGNLERSPEP